MRGINCQNVVCVQRSALSLQEPLQCEWEPLSLYIENAFQEAAMKHLLSLTLLSFAATISFAAVDEYTLTIKDPVSYTHLDVYKRQNRTWAAFGIQGLAPYWFELDLTGYVGEEGRTALRLSAEYELLLTQRLVLQPRLEANLYGKSDEARGIGSGLSDAVAGLRLRYEVNRQFAPYVGVEWASKFGQTADLAKAEGNPRSETLWVAGVRFWF